MNKILLSLLIAIGITSCGFNKTPSTITKYCSIDKIQGASKVDEKQYSIENGLIFSFAGWAIDLEGGQVANEISFNLVSAGGVVHNIANSKLNFERPDISSNYKNNAFLKSGFNINAKVNNLEAGIYSLEIVQEFNDKIGVCATDKLLVIK